MADELAPKAVDRRVSLYQAVVELCPVIGPIVSKVVAEVIPNQRVDRMADVIRRLDEEVRELKEGVQEKFAEPEFVDFLEEGLWQATRAATPERRAYIAKLLKNGLTTERADLSRERRLMTLLGDLNDLELVLLQLHNAADMQDEETLARLRDLAIGPSAHLGSQLEEIERDVLHRSHRDRLAQIGLLRPRFPHLKRGELPEFDRNAGRFKATSYEITPLGRLLMKALDQRTIYDKSKD